MATSQQGQVTVDPSVVERAARLAKLMTAAEASSNPGDPWTAQDVLNVALLRGLDAIELQYSER